MNHGNPQHCGPQSPENAAAEVPPDVSADHGRRRFLKKSIRAAAFVAPVVLAFKPRDAIAGSGGSAITPGP